MIASSSVSILATFLIFCRIGTCMMVAPGYSRVNIPTQIRLFLAISVTLMLHAPAGVHGSPGCGSGDGAGSPPPDHVRADGGPGHWTHCTHVLRCAGNDGYIRRASGIGLTLPGVADDGEHVPALVPLITLTATVVFFVTDQHWELLRGLVGSYQIWLPATGISAEGGLTQLVDHLSMAFTLALRVASPFVIYAVIVNFAVGLANKPTPSIPVCFISIHLPTHWRSTAALSHGPRNVCCNSASPSASWLSG